MAKFQVPIRPREEDVPAGEILAGKYRAERVIGAGAMGVVVQVVSLERNEVFALKFLRPSVARNSSAAQRFLREAEASGRIKNPHVVAIAEVGALASGSPFMVMEHLEGQSLEERLSGGGGLPLEQACDLALQTAEGLASAHAMGVIHRDIKPSNLFLTRGPDGTLLLKILDFGISKILDLDPGQQLTRTQTSIGSPLYMSPEQMRSARTADFRTDQWSLGVVLYRMVTGRLPFEGNSLPQLCYQVLEGSFVPVTTLRPDLPLAFSAAVERCLRRLPDERYTDIAALAAALVPFVASDAHGSADRCRAILDKTTS
jgi:serine/threonine protein kinase